MRMGSAWALAGRRERALKNRELYREAERLAAAFARDGADRVILFGSVARGTASATSDIDLVVVTPMARGQPVGGRGRETLLGIAPRAPVDLLVYTPEEWAEMSSRPFVRREICEGGRSLYERGTGP